MDPICAFSGCGQRGDNVCMCLKPAEIYICTGHLSEHISVPGPKPHYNKNLYKVPEPAVKAFLISHFNGLIRDLRRLKLKVEDELLILTEEQATADQIYELIDGDISKLEGIIQEILSKEDIPKKAVTDADELMSSHTVENAIELIKKKHELQSQYLLDCEEINAYPLTEKIQGYDIALFEHDSKILRSISFRDWEIEYNELALPVNIDFRTCMCLIPGMKIFCYGNTHDQVPTGLTFTVDFQNNVKMLATGTPSRSAGAAYCNGWVYVFGGHSLDKPLALAEKYSLTRNVWTKLNPLPKAFYYPGVCNLGNYMIMSGVGTSFAYIYDILISSYQQVIKLDEENSTKIICQGNQRGYIIETKGKIWESRIGDPYIWQVIEESDIPSWHLVSYRVSYMNNIYFITDEYPCPTLYRFSLDTKDCKIIRSIPDREEVSIPA